MVALHFSISTILTISSSYFFPVKVEVHSSSSGAGSEESSDLSERGSRVGDHDYEDIYSLGVTEVGPAGRKMARSRSRDSGHSRYMIDRSMMCKARG